MAALFDSNLLGCQVCVQTKERVAMFPLRHALDDSDGIFALQTRYDIECFVSNDQFCQQREEDGSQNACNDQR